MWLESVTPRNDFHIYSRCVITNEFLNFSCEKASLPNLWQDLLEAREIRPSHGSISSINIFLRPVPENFQKYQVSAKPSKVHTHERSQKLPMRDLFSLFQDKTEPERTPGSHSFRSEKLCLLWVRVQCEDPNGFGETPVCS